MKQLSIIIPCYQEANNLSFLLPLIKKELNETNINYELIIVDTAQPMDNTKNITLQNGFIYINRQPTNFYGDAIRTGVQKANGEYTIFMDGDGSHSPSFIKNLFEKRGNNKIIIASRYIKGGGSANNLPLYLMSKFLNIIYSVVLNIKCADMSNSFKLYPTKLLKAISIECNNFDLVEEIIVKVKINEPQLEIVELPFYFETKKRAKQKEIYLNS